VLGRCVSLSIGVSCGVGALGEGWQDVQQLGDIVSGGAEGQGGGWRGLRVNQLVLFSLRW